MSEGRTRQVIIGVAELLAEVEYTLAHQLGPVVGALASVIEPQPLLSALMEEFFYGGAVSVPGSMEQLLGYQTPTEIAAQLLRALNAGLIGTIEAHTGRLQPGMQYSFQPYGQTAYLVQEYRPRFNYSVPDRTPSYEELALNTSLGLAGDYYPERQRRAVQQTHREILEARAERNRAQRHGVAPAGSVVEYLEMLRQQVMMT